MKKMTLTALSLLVALAASTALATDAKPPVPGKEGPHHGMGHHMFKEVDANKDGIISKEEWNANGEKMFNKLDTNHDGKISKEEIKAHHEKMRAKMEKHWEHKDESSDRPVTPTGILRN